MSWKPPAQFQHLAGLHDFVLPRMTARECQGVFDRSGAVIKSNMAGSERCISMDPGSLGIHETREKAAFGDWANLED